MPAFQGNGGRYTPARSNYDVVGTYRIHALIMVAPSIQTKHLCAENGSVLMTREEFEEGYARRSGMTVERLHELGQVAIPCACGEDGCKGWAMVNKEGTLNEEADDG